MSRFRFSLFRFTNFLQNSMRVQDRKAIEEIWSVFEKAYQQQNKQTTQVKKTPKKEPMKFDSSRPWYEQLSSGSSGKKQKKEESSDSSSSSSDEETSTKKPMKRAVETTKSKAPPAKKTKKESSSSSCSSE